jgi:hypothetical protein
VLVSFPSPRQNTCDKTYLAHSFSPWSADSIVLGLWEGRIIAGSMWLNKAVHLMVGGKQRQKKRKELGSQYPLQGHTLNDLASFYQAPPLKGFIIS